MRNIMVAKKTLKDYGIWRPLFDGNTPTQAAYGLHIKGVYQSNDDTNTVFVILEINDIAQAQAIMRKAQESGLLEKAGFIDADRTLCVDVTSAASVFPLTLSAAF